MFCGDFNSTPDCGIYQLFTTGYVDENFIDWRSSKLLEIHFLRRKYLSLLMKIVPTQ